MREEVVRGALFLASRIRSAYYSLTPCFVDAIDRYYSRFDSNLLSLLMMMLLLIFHYNWTHLHLDIYFDFVVDTIVTELVDDSACLIAERIHSIIRFR
jgi:hypothetical protein